MKYICFLGGIIMSLFGMIGVLLPILPTTPFLLFALFLFTKSSRKAEQWFLTTKLYQNHLEMFIRERSMTLRNKIILLSSLVL